MAKRKTAARKGIYIRDIPADEIRDVAQRIGVGPEAVIGMLLRPYEGRVAEAVSENVRQQLIGLLSQEGQADE